MLGRHSAIAVRLIAIVMAVRICVSVARGIDVRVAGVVVICIDALVGLLIVRRHGKRGLVGIDVAVAGAQLAIVIAGQVAVEFPVRERVGADECRGSKEETRQTTGLDLCTTGERIRTMHTRQRLPVPQRLC